MKKSIAIFLIMLSVFTGCGKQTDTIESKITDEISGETQSVQIDQLKNQNFLYPEEAGFNQDGAYITDRNLDGSYCIKYVDFKSSQEMYLCADISCLHSDESCNAYIPSNVGGVALAILKDRLIILTKGNTIDTPPQIKSISLNGSTPKILQKFETSERVITPYITGDNALYFILEQAEKSENQKVCIKQSLISIDVITGEMKNIMSVEDNTFLRGVASNEFLFKTIKSNKHNIYTVKLKGEKSSTIYEYEQGNGIEFEDNGVIYFMNFIQNKMQRINLDGNIEDLYPIEFQGSSSSTYFRSLQNDELIVDNTIFDSKTSQAQTKRYAISLQTGKTTEITFEITRDQRRSPVWLLALTDEYALAIVDYNIKESSGTDKDGNIFTEEISSPVLGLFLKENYITNNFKYKTVDEI